MQEKQRNKILEEKLRAAKTSTVLTALNDMKHQGNVSLVPVLLEMLAGGPVDEVEKEIIFILNNLKVQKAAPVLAEALQNPEYLSIRKKITTACWQNGLNYKNYLPLFVDIIINEDWETGFEAFTVIENMEEFPEKNMIDLTIDKIQDALPNVTERKKYFLQEILLLIC